MLCCKLIIVCHVLQLWFPAYLFSYQSISTHVQNTIFLTPCLVFQGRWSGFNGGSVQHTFFSTICQGKPLEVKKKSSTSNSFLWRLYYWVRVEEIVKLKCVKNFFFVTRSNFLSPSGWALSALNYQRSLRQIIINTLLIEKQAAGNHDDEGSCDGLKSKAPGPMYSSSFL